MTDINFYVGKQDNLDARLLIAYRLTTMAFERNMQVHIHTDNAESCQKMDKLLWIKEAHSFLPHAIVEDEESSEKITLSHEYEPMTNCDYLINLSNQRPNFFSRFKKMAEVIDQDDSILNAGRQRYKFYQERGYTLEYHML